MTLQFDSGSYGQAYQQGQDNRFANEQLPLETLALLSQGVNTYQTGIKNRDSADQQKKLYELQLAEAQRKGKEADLESTPLGQLLSSNQISSSVAPQSMLEQVQMPPGMGEAGMPMGQQPGMPRGGLVEQFRSGAWKNRLNQPPQMQMGPQQQPDLSAFGLPPEAAGMTVGQVKKVGEARKLFADARAEKQPGSIEAILAQKYNNGEISLEQLMQMKKSMAPEGAYMMGGMTQGGAPVFYNSKDPSQVRTGQVPGGGLLYPKTPSEGQMNAGLFGKRAMEANQQLETMISGGFDPTSLGTGAARQLPNMMQPENVQKLEQAENNFMAAVLRKESGALISQEERTEGGKQYFPRAGDTPGVLEQKDINRKTAVQGLGTMAGPMGNQMKTTSPQPQQSVGWDQSKESRYQELLRKRGGQ